MALLNNKRWHILPPPPAGLAASLGVTPLQARILHNRGVTELSHLEEFFSEGRFHDPFLLPDMGKAVARVRTALESGEVVGVFGDFDADGVTGTALLTQSLRDLGLRVVPYIPHRVDEGHGLNFRALDELRTAQVTLLVTVDCGTTSVEEVRYASDLGMDVVITDHHSIPPLLPAAAAIVNHNRPDSRYPFRGLAGVGLAFKLAQAMYSHFDRDYPTDLLELATLGTVADVVPLRGENRSLVAAGLKALNATRRPGLQALMSNARLSPGQIDTEAIAYGLAPRLNAAGRLDHAVTSFQLLTTSSHQEAQRLASILEEQNSSRRRLTEDALDTARSKAQSQSAQHCVILVGEAGQPPGISGLIAGKLVEEFYRPAISYSTDGTTIRASARSIPEFDVSSAFAQCSDLFLRFGGHPMAAGFVMDTANLEILESRLRSIARERLSHLDLAPTLFIDAEVAPVELIGETFRFLETLAPFGESNPSPTFVTRGAQVVDAAPMGQNGRHLRVRLKTNGALWDATAFWRGEDLHQLKDRVDVVFNVGLGRWMAQKTIKLNILDFSPSQLT